MQKATRWDNFSQLIISSEFNQVITALSKYMDQSGLILRDVTSDPEMWENSLFVLEARAENGGATILSEPETPPPDWQITDEFSFVFMEFAGFDGVFVSNDNYFNLLQLITFRKGTPQLMWMDSNLPTALRNLPSFARLYNEDGTYHEEKALEYLKRLFNREEINLYDGLIQVEFVEKMVSELGVLFTPSVGFLDIKRVLQPSE